LKKGKLLKRLKSNEQRKKKKRGKLGSELKAQQQWYRQIKGQKAVTKPGTLVDPLRKGVRLGGGGGATCETRQALKKRGELKKASILTTSKKKQRGEGGIELKRECKGVEGRKIRE